MSDTIKRMKLVEKKYRVVSFDAVLDVLRHMGAKQTIEISSTHYYAHLPTDDTLKMVAEEGKVEIHRLSTQQGLHTLQEIITVPDVEAGFRWFVEQGYDALDVLAMYKVEYDYGDGGLALYDVDAVVHSVVMGYPEEQLSKMEGLFGLQSAEQITVPFNKYLGQLGALRSMRLGV